MALSRLIPFGLCRLRINMSSQLCHIGPAMVLGSGAVQWPGSPVCDFAQLIRMDVGTVM